MTHTNYTNLCHRRLLECCYHLDCLHSSVNCLSDSWMRNWYRVTTHLVVLLVRAKGLDIYIPPLTGKPWPAAVYNSKWRTDRQWQKWRSAGSGSPLPEWTDFGPRSLQPDRPTYAPVSCTMAFTAQCSPAVTHCYYEPFSCAKQLHSVGLHLFSYSLFVFWLFYLYCLWVASF